MLAEGSGVYAKLAEDIWLKQMKDQGKTKIEVAPEFYTTKLALAVIAYAGFGIKDMDDVYDEVPHDMTKLKTAVRLMVEQLILKLALPNIAYKLPFEYLRRAGTAFENFEVM